MQTIVIGNSLLVDELAIAQQLISDTLTRCVVDVLMRLWRQRRPIGEPFVAPMVVARGAMEAPHRGAP